MVSILSRALWREIRRRPAQFFSVALVIALGVGMFNASFDAFLNLTGSYEELYRETRLAHVTAIGGPTEQVLLHQRHQTEAESGQQDRIAVVVLHEDLDRPARLEIDRRGDLDRGQFAEVATLFVVAPALQQARSRDIGLLLCGFNQVAQQIDARPAHAGNFFHVETDRSLRVIQQQRYRPSHHGRFPGRARRGKAPPRPPARRLVLAGGLRAAERLLQFARSQTHAPGE